MTKVRRVLVADDDASIRELLLLNLQVEGYEVSSAVDGVDALEKAFASPPDLIVLDVMMPRADGIEVLRRLRVAPETRDIPVVLLTAKTTEAEMWEGWRAGADYYLTKPFNLEELLHFVTYLSAQKRGQVPAESVHRLA